MSARSMGMALFVSTAVRHRSWSPGEPGGGKVSPSSWEGSGALAAGAEGVQSAPGVGVLAGGAAGSAARDAARTTEDSALHDMFASRTGRAGRCSVQEWKQEPVARRFLDPGRLDDQAAQYALGTGDEAVAGPPPRLDGSILDPD